MAFSSLTATPIERKVREATSDDGWKPSERVLMEIADATHSYKNLPIIMNVIWKRLNDHNRNWKKLYKGLLVLEYIMKHGSDQVRVEVQVRKVEVQTLTMFQHGKSFDGKDIGLHVRDKAKEILEWLEAHPPGSKKQAAKAPSAHSNSTPQPLPTHISPTPTPVPVPMHYQPQPVPQQFGPPQPQPVAVHPSAFGQPQPQPGFAPQPIPQPGFAPQPMPQPGFAPQPMPQPGFAPQPVPQPYPPQPSFNPNTIPALPPKPQPSLPQPHPSGPQQFSAPPPSSDPFGASRNAGGFDPFESSADDPFSRASQQAPPQSPYGYQQNQNPFASP